MLDIKGTGCTRMIVKGKENEYDRTVKPSFQGTLFSSPVSLISPTHLLFTSPAAHCETQYILYRQLFLASKKSASAPCGETGISTDRLVQRGFVPRKARNM